MDDDYKDDLQCRLRHWLEKNCSSPSEALTVLANVFAGIAMQSVPSEEKLKGLFEYIVNGTMKEFRKQRKTSKE